MGFPPLLLEDLISISLKKKFPWAVVEGKNDSAETNPGSSYRRMFCSRASAYFMETKELFVSSRKPSDVKSPL